MWALSFNTFLISDQISVILFLCVCVCFFLVFSFIFVKLFHNKFNEVCMDARISGFGFRSIDKSERMLVNVNFQLKMIKVGSWMVTNPSQNFIQMNERKTETHKN